MRQNYHSSHGPPTSCFLATPMKCHEHSLRGYTGDARISEDGPNRIDLRSLDAQRRVSPYIARPTLNVSFKAHSGRIPRLTFLFRCLGATNAVPVICSAYKPNLTHRGLFCPFGIVPGTASDSKWLPKPGWYCLHQQLSIYIDLETYVIWIVFSCAERRDGPVLLRLSPVEDVLVLSGIVELCRHGRWNRCYCVHAGRMCLELRSLRIDTVPVALGIVKVQIQA